MDSTTTFGALALGFLLAMINLVKYFDTRKDYKGGNDTRQILIEEFKLMTIQMKALTEAFQKHEDNSQETRESLKQISSKHETIKVLVAEVCKK